jgi:hypothetical protein
MTVRLLLSFAVSFAIGWLIVSLLWPAGADGSRPQRLVAIFLGFATGHGVTSCIAFLYLLVHGRADGWYYLAELPLLACLLFAFWRVRQRRRDRAPPACPAASDVPPRFGGRLLPSAFYVTAVMALATIALRIWQAPHGGYDAWVIWNARARALFRSGDAWRDNIWNAGIAQSQLDYPLLLPASVVRAWMYAGGETLLAPALLAWLFTAATIGLMTAAVAALCGRSHGYVAGIVLLGYTVLILHANSQVAEAPVMLLYLAALASIALYNGAQPQTHRGALVVAGLAAGLAAWTKNEGLLFLLALGIAHAVSVLYSAGMREWSRQLVALAAGLLPLAVIILYFKAEFAPANIMMLEMSEPAEASLATEFRRYMMIGKLVAQRLVLYEGPGINMAYVLAILLVCFGVSRKHLVSVAQAGLVVTIMFSGFMGIYFLRAQTGPAFVGGSLDRLLLQLWPAVVFGFFLLAAPREAAHTLDKRPA